LNLACVRRSGLSPATHCSCSRSPVFIRGVSIGSTPWLFKRG
jgi:hypothetical protein